MFLGAVSDAAAAAGGGRETPRGEEIGSAFGEGEADKEESVTLGLTIGAD